jgi:alcohol dehydrogenase
VPTCAPGTILGHEAVASVTEVGSAVFLADILPTAFEVGVLNGRAKPGDTIAIVGVGPIGLATIMTAQLYTPARIIAIDR